MPGAGKKNAEISKKGNVKKLPAMKKAAVPKAKAKAAANVGKKKGGTAVKKKPAAPKAKTKSAADVGKKKGGTAMKKKSAAPEAKAKPAADAGEKKGGTAMKKRSAAPEAEAKSAADAGKKKGGTAMKKKSAASEAKSDTAAGVAKMEDCTTGASAEKDAKQGEAEKYKYVVYLADIYEAEERSTSDNEEEENSDRSEYRAGHGYTEVPENDVSVMKIDSDDCGTLAFWAAIDSHCDDLKEEMRQKCAYHDEEAHDVCDVEDNRSYWMSNVIAKGHSYNKSKIFGESSEVSKDEWDRGVPKGATLLFKIRADWTYLDWEWDCDEEPLRRQQNAVWVKRMKITEDENVYEKI